MKKTALILAAIVAFVFSTKAQDMHFSQYNETPLLVNPALTGVFDGNHRIGLNYKNQWKNIGTAYNTYDLSYDISFNKGNTSNGFLALGVVFFNDVAGDIHFQTTGGILNLAYQLHLNEFQILGAGLYGGFSQKSLNEEGMMWVNQYDGTSGYDASMPSNEIFDLYQFGYSDFGFGLNYELTNSTEGFNSNKGFRLNAGFAVQHVTQPKYQFTATANEKLDMKMIGHIRSFIQIGESNMSLVPSFYIAMQGKQKEILPGLCARYTLREESKYTGFIKKAYLTFGGYFRTGDAAIIQTLFEINDIGLGVSYDVNVSNLTDATNGNGGIEIALRYIIRNPNNNKSLF
ncbi:MAG: hypothetical protein CVU11_10700 [Bacteroidetes bacterium HGW-Bacteroidetes-6]|jgi:type IX secretion system PorP/SprF family membrane protein|nr:MAG: hypothetical protein CVU11_10700 [Bacteroidetes bacterium HGW-Bacteroidetes-6]